LRTPGFAERGASTFRVYNRSVRNPLGNDSSAVLEPISQDARTAGLAHGCMECGSLKDAARDSSVATRIIDRPVITAFILGVASLLFFLAGIRRPAFTVFDEGLYVPEARAFFHGTLDAYTQLHNLARPPFGKMLLAICMKAAGDTPFGWRVGAAVCGSLTLVAVYFWALLLLSDRRIAIFAAALTFFNNFLFVMSRVGMLDAFFVAFLLWSLVAYTAAIVLDVRTGSRRVLLGCSGVLIGFAGACKWNAIDTLAALALASFALLWVARRSPAPSIPCLCREAQNMQQIGAPTMLLSLVIAPIISYSLTYWPFCRILHRPFKLMELIAMHRYMWSVSTHWVTSKTLTSAWYKWPLTTSPERPLSYLLGNPVVTWGGIAALVFCLRRFWKDLALPEGMVVLLYSANYFQWALTPVKNLFYYYYYPAVMILGVAIAIALRSLPRSIFGVRVSLLVLIAAAAVFVWCYPRMTHLDPPWDCALGCWS
jgi:dolichyl-phosphate-mannose-protein mannosyltransferase